MHLRAAASLQVDLQDQGAINDSRRSGAGAQNGFSEAAGGLCDSLDEKQASEQIITNATDRQATSRP
jgi:hypothetical protein